MFCAVNYTCDFPVIYDSNDVLIVYENVYEEIP